MKSPPAPEDEAARIATLRELLILDSGPEERFDAPTAYCTTRFRVEIALVSFVDVDRQWFKSACGLDVHQTAREVSFCAHAILSDDILVIEDALADERFRDNPLVTGPPHIRFCAGAPLTVGAGHPVGTLCLIGTRPCSLDDGDRAPARTRVRHGPGPGSTSGRPGRIGLTDHRGLRRQARWTGSPTCTSAAVTTSP